MNRRREVTMSELTVMRRYDAEAAKWHFAIMRKRQGDPENRSDVVEQWVTTMEAAGEHWGQQRIKALDGDGKK